MRDEQAEADREFYRRAGRLQLANRIIEYIRDEVERWKTPFSPHELAPGYKDIIQFLEDELEADRGIQ